MRDRGRKRKKITRIKNPTLQCCLPWGQTMAPLYSSIFVYACQPVLTVSISCMKEHIPREIWGNVSSGVLLSHKDLSVFHRYKALTGKAWDETCEFRRQSSVHSVIMMCHTFSVIIPKRNSDLLHDIFWLHEDYSFAKHDFTLSFICYTAIL